MSGVTVNNRAPVLTAVGAKDVNEGQTLTIQLEGRDADNDGITYAASPLPSGAVMDQGTGTFTWTTTFTQSGTYNVRFSVTDGLFEDYEDVVITVINVKKGKGKY